jgi:hypothetical protein
MYCSLCKRNLSPLEALGMSLLAGVAAVAAVSVVAKVIAPPAVAGFDDESGSFKRHKKRQARQAMAAKFGKKGARQAMRSEMKERGFRTGPVASYGRLLAPKRRRAFKRARHEARQELLSQGFYDETGDLAYIPLAREERGLDAAQEYGWGY